MPRRNIRNKQSHKHLPQPAPGQSCRSKQRFPTKKQALRAADDQMLSDFHLQLDVYHCEFCKGWHLTSREK